MLKFIKHHMTSIDGIEIYPIISLSIFFLFFIGLIIYAMTMNKGFVSEMSNAPLTDDLETENEGL